MQESVYVTESFEILLLLAIRVFVRVCVLACVCLLDNVQDCSSPLRHGHSHSSGICVHANDYLDVLFVQGNQPSYKSLAAAAR
jgi:hypothetical protein